MEHRVTANSEFASELPLFEGNSSQLRQVILNVVQNSIEAMSVTRHQKRILQMTPKRSGQNAIALKIQDSGVGIKPEQLDKIFDAFVTTKRGGMGLGLAICRTIVLRHGGQLTASSDGKNGALFEMVLPISFSNSIAPDI